jgi:hypothetical protein
MLRLKQQIPNSRSQERPRREETRSGKDYPRAEADELRMEIGWCCGMVVEEEKEGWRAEPRQERGVDFAQAPVEAASQRLTIS